MEKSQRFLMAVMGLVLGLLASLVLTAPQAAAQVDSPAAGTCQVETVVETALSQRQCDGLTALYWATRGPDWANQLGWNTASDPCTWGGVTCAPGDGFDVVEQVEIHANGLAGYLPEQIDGLWGLKKLRLSANNISGELPPHLGHLQAIEVIDLSDNAITGVIPDRIGDLPRLRVLDLSRNQLSGHIPNRITNLDALVQLQLDNNGCLLADGPTKQFVAQLVESSDLSECIINSIQVSCLAGNGRLDIDVLNELSYGSLYSVRVGNLGPRYRTIPPGETARVTVTGRNDGPIDVIITRGTGFSVHETVTVDCDPDERVITTTHCVGDNGTDRMVHVVSTNDGDNSATYKVHVNGLAPRTRVIDPGRSKGAPVVLRYPGAVTVVVVRDGVQIHREVLEFDC